MSKDTPDSSPQESDSSPSRPPRHTSSKYDFVKVRVWIGENSDHYYVISRFLISRMLTVTKIPMVDAIKIALELKKLLVDARLLDVSQSDLEANLFELMKRRGYGEEYVDRYKMMTEFYHQRVPLIVLVCGTACVGKSTIATQLAQRLNLPNVLQTDIVYELLRTSVDAPLNPKPIWTRDFKSNEDLIAEFCRECRIVRKGMDGDLAKAIRDGKPIIIEGEHLDPSIFLQSHQSSNLMSLAPESDAEQSLKSDLTEKEGQNLNERDKLTEKTSKPNKEQKRKSIIVPIVLKMEGEDHQMLLNEWMACRKNDFPDSPQVNEEEVLRKLNVIQDYLCSFESKGVAVINVTTTTFQKTLEVLHTYLLQCIEKGCATDTS